MLGASVAYGAIALPYSRRMKRTRSSCCAARWWALLLAVSQLLALLSEAEAVGWRGTGAKAGQRGAPTSSRADEDMSEALRVLERKQVLLYWRLTPPTAQHAWLLFNRSVENMSHVFPLRTRVDVRRLF